MEKINLFLHSEMPQIGFLLIMIFIFYFTIGLLWVAGKSALNVIFFELALHVRNQDKEKIIQWINKYGKIPFFLKIALRKNNNTCFNDVYNTTYLYKNLQKEMPTQISKKKVNKI